MELNQTSIDYCDRRLARIASCTETTDAIVPDTFPDIGRVVCAYGTVSIKDQTPQNDRLLISGMVKTTVLYQPEDGSGLRRLHIPISFAHIEECEGVGPDTTCFVSCTVAGVDASSVNSRKLSVSAQLCFELECYQSAKCTVTEGVADSRVEQLCAPCTVSLVERAQSGMFTVLEDVSLSDATDLLLLHTQCALRVNECRAMHGKVVLKGEAAVSCLALQPDDAVRTLTSNTPFTQIIEMPGITEGDIVASRLAVRELDCRLEPDGLLSYTVGGTALFTVRTVHTLQNLSDLYIPGKEISLHEEKVVLHSVPPSSSMMGEASETLQTAFRASHIISVSAVCCGIKQGEDDITTVNTAVQVLYLNDEQQLCSLSRQLPLEFACPSRGSLSQVELTARAASAGESGIALTVSASGQLAADTRCTLRCISDIEVCDAKTERDGVTLVLRVIDQEQPLWQIAKSCGTTMDAIRRANELPAEVSTVADMMLLIPIQS